MVEYRCVLPQRRIKGWQLRLWRAAVAALFGRYVWPLLTKEQSCLAGVHGCPLNTAIKNGAVVFALDPLATKIQFHGKRKKFLGYNYYPDKIYFNFPHHIHHNQYLLSNNVWTIKIGYKQLWNTIFRNQSCPSYGSNIYGGNNGQFHVLRVLFLSFNSTIYKNDIDWFNKGSGTRLYLASENYWRVNSLTYCPFASHKPPSIQ